MYRLSFVIFLVLASCAPRGIGEQGVYRDAASPIYSNALFDSNRLDGAWDQVAAFMPDGQSRCRSGGAEFDAKSGDVGIAYQLCLSGREVSGVGVIAATGPGRFAVKGTDGIGQDWWVLWVDESYRTMAIGSPSGAFGFVLNRGKALPVDRRNAAIEVFDFNGYDTAKLAIFRK